MRILLVKNSIIPPQNYGGTQRLVYWLAMEYLSMGHQVSICANPISPIFTHPKIGYFSFPKNNDFSKISPTEFDIIHFHEIPQKSPYKVPYVFTMHGNQTQSEILPENTLFISQSHAKNHGGIYFVHNGIPLSDYNYSEEKKDILLFLAKVNWRVKNAPLAVKLALQTNFRLNLAGGKLHKAWKIWSMPLLFNALRLKMIHGLTNFSSIGGQNKLKLLSESSLFFHIANWSEPFGLSPMEALASGTPVITNNNGALPEYITNKYNGYIVSSLEEAKQAILEHRNLSCNERKKISQNCLASVITSEAMAKNYLFFYEKIIQNDRLYKENQQPIFQFKKPKLTIIK